MKKILITALAALVVSGCVNHSQASSKIGLQEAKTADQAMLTGRASGICATYEKMFTYAGSTGKKADMDFAKAFYTYSANDLGYTPQGFLDFCKGIFEKSKQMQQVIDEYK